MDCPPVLGLADCLALLPLADAVLLVVRSGRTRGGAILETTDQLERVGVRLDAAVLTDVQTPRGRHYGYGYYLASPEYLRPEKESQRWSPRLISPTLPVEARGNGNGATGEADTDIAISNGASLADEIDPTPVVSGADEL
jgi:Mrp family chromosome partitioning ATPase